MVKQTLGGTNRKRKRTSGFLVRMKNFKGKKIIKLRRKKGRKIIGV